MNRDTITQKVEQILISTHDHPKKHIIKDEKKKLTFACPVCGDSEKDMGRKRAHILFDKAEPYFYCHHECGALSLPKFFNQFGVEYKEDVFEFFQGPVTIKSKLSYDPKIMALSEISRLSVHIMDVMRAFGLQNIKPGDEAYQYLESRDLLHVAHYMAYSPKWKRIIIFNTLTEPDFEKQYGPKGERIIRSAKVVGFQARDITGKDSTKYLTYSLERIRTECGLDYKPKRGCDDYIKIMANTYYSTHINPYEPILVVEGPIDALLLPNCMALTGAAKTNWNLNKNANAQYIFDNDEAGKKKATEVWTKWPETTKIFDWIRLCKQIGNDTVKDINDVWSHCKRNGIEMPDLNKFLV